MSEIGGAAVIIWPARAILLLQKTRRMIAALGAYIPWRDLMPTFMLSMNFTEQGIRGIKDGPKRAQAARDLAKKVGVEIKHLYLTSGDSDLVSFVEAANGDNVAKFALALGSLGNVRTRTARVWSAEEYVKLVSELP
jgi:uncharacterized protein with GYD domain